MKTVFDIYLFISCPLFILETIVFFFRDPKIKRLPCFRNTRGGRERWRDKERERSLKIGFKEEQVMPLQLEQK